MKRLLASQIMDNLHQKKLSHRKLPDGISERELEKCGGKRFAQSDDSFRILFNTQNVSCSAAIQLPEPSVLTMKRSLFDTR